MVVVVRTVTPFQSSSPLVTNVSARPKYKRARRASAVVSVSKQPSNEPVASRVLSSILRTSDVPYRSHSHKLSVADAN
ncbi:hypothetical protein ABBQ32_009812 [Trebouxia sp. C0010 RCD-2024]